MKAFIIAAFIGTAFTSCKKESLLGNGDTKTELRNVAGFSKIKVDGSTDLTITQGSNYRVEVKAHNNLLPLLETKVVDGTLCVGFKRGTSVINNN